MRILLIIWIIFCSSDAYSREIVLGVSSRNSIPLPPYLWYDKCEKKVYGQVIQMFARLMRDTGHTLKAPPAIDIDKPELSNFRELRFHQLLAGDVDLIIASPALAKHPDATIGTVAAIIVKPVFFLKNTTQLPASLNDMKNYHGAIEYSSRHLKKELAAQGIVPMEVSTTRSILRMVMRGEIDYGISDKRIIAFAASASGASDKVTILDLGLPHSEFFIAARSGTDNVALLSEFDLMLKQYRESGLIDHMIDANLRRWAHTTNCISD